MEGLNPVEFDGVENTLIDAGFGEQAIARIIGRLEYAVIEINGHMEEFSEIQERWLKNNISISSALRLLQADPNAQDPIAALAQPLGIRHDDPKPKRLVATEESPFVALDLIKISARVINGTTTTLKDSEIKVKGEVYFVQESEQEHRTAEGQIVDLNRTRNSSEPISERELAGILYRAYTTGWCFKHQVYDNTEMSLREGEDAADIIITESFYTRVKEKLERCTDIFLANTKMLFGTTGVTSLESLIKTVMEHGIRSN